MASSDATQRAVLAGLSCGIGLAAPVVMYAATLPFSSVNSWVSTSYSCRISSRVKISCGEPLAITLPDLMAYRRSQ